MEQKNQINEVLGLTMQKLKDMVDVNTVVGTPITTPDGVTVIPVSKISVGFASGGSDFAPKSLPANKANCFGGGTGAGISVVPVSFLIIHGDNVRIINADPVSNGPIDKAIDLLPELVDKVSGMIEQRKAAGTDTSACVQRELAVRCALAVLDPQDLLELFKNDAGTFDITCRAKTYGDLVTPFGI